MVDALLARCPTPEDYKAIPRSGRMELVRELVKDMRQEQEQAVHVDTSQPAPAGP